MFLPHDALGRACQRALYRAGHAAGLLAKAAGDARSVYALKGRLVRSASNWGLLEVPNAIVRGLFAALHEPGVELPPSGPDGRLNAHISVLRKEECAALGDRVSEWGRFYAFQLGPVQVVEPAGWDEMSRCWFVAVRSPELEAFRKSYGLTPLPRRGNTELPFHLTIAVRRKGVLAANAVAKAAAGRGYFCETCLHATDREGIGKCPECSGDLVPDTDHHRWKYDKAWRKRHAGEFCPSCGAMHERGDDRGVLKCNRCGAPWPDKAAAAIAVPAALAAALR